MILFIYVCFIFYRTEDLNWEIFDGKISNNEANYQWWIDKKLFLISEDKSYSFETLFQILIRKFQDTCSSVIEEFLVAMPCTHIGGYRDYTPFKESVVNVA